jgi:hypothetical protein
MMHGVYVKITFILCYFILNSKLYILFVQVSFNIH